MELVALNLALAELTADALNAEDAVPVVHLRDGDVAVALGSMAGHLRRPVGMWLTLSSDYGAGVAARDVRTVSHLVELADVVVDGLEPAAQAEAIRALLTGGPVTLANEAVTLTDAYSLPVPPAPVRVWQVEERDPIGHWLVAPGESPLRASAHEGRATPDGRRRLYRSVVAEPRP
jgi:hypothetical protein